MDVIELPILGATASLGDAFEAMKQSSRSGVICSVEGELRLVAAGKIVRGGRLYQALGQLPGVPILEITKTSAKNLPLDFIRPHATARTYEAILDQAERMYGVLQPTSGSPTARVVTRHESLAMELGHGPKDCYCSNEPEHGWDPQEVSQFKKDPQGRPLCQTCNKPVDCA